MKIAVLLKEVVDLVEELVIADDGNSLDRDELSYRSNEFDDYALVEGLSLKDDTTTVDAYGLEGSETKQLLHMAAARGADKLFKVVPNGFDPEEGISSRMVANAFVKAIADQGYDLILTGVQGVDDIDGQISGHVAQMMGLPSLNVVVQLKKAEGNKITCFKEFSGGVIGEYEVELPAVVGIQASTNHPGYIPVSKIRKIAQEATIEEKAVDLDELTISNQIGVKLPEIGSAAEMIPGDVDAQIAKVIEILSERGLLG